MTRPGHRRRRLHRQPHGARAPRRRRERRRPRQSVDRLPLGGARRRHARRRRRRRSGPRRAASCAEHGVKSIIHFAGSIVVPEFGRRSARLLSQQHRQVARPAWRSAVEMRRASTSSSPRPPPSTACRSRCPVREDAAARAHVALRLVQADDRDHAGRHRARARSPLRGAALFQRRRRRPARAARASRRRTPRTSSRSPARRRSASAPHGGVRHRLSDARRHLHPRLHPRHRPRARAHGGAAPPARWRRQRRSSTAATARVTRCWR